MTLDRLVTLDGREIATVVNTQYRPFTDNTYNKIVVLFSISLFNLSNLSNLSKVSKFNAYRVDSL